MSLPLLRAREGDPRAVDRVTQALRPRLTRMAAYYARRTGEDPDDLLQEACYGLLEALRELDLSIGSPEQYLLKRARWRMLDSVRRARIRRCLPLEAETDRRADCPMEGVLSRAHVSAFADQLNAPQRDILAALLSGMTWREAGNALGCTSANIAYHVRQIRRRYEDWTQASAVRTESCAGHRRSLASQPAGTI